MLQEELFISFLKKFDDSPFLVKMNGKKISDRGGETRFYRETS